jgi:hypothetical protein
LPELTVLLNEFYRNGKKIIPDNLVLDPIILAVWFMDDGSRCGPYSFYLNTQQYSLEDQKKIIRKLKEIGMEARLNRDKSYWRIIFLSSSVGRLRELIADKVIPSMKYKIELNPVETWSGKA